MATGQEVPLLRGLCRQGQAVTMVRPIPDRRADRLGDGNPPLPLGSNSPAGSRVNGNDGASLLPAGGPTASEHVNNP